MTTSETMSLKSVSCLDDTKVSPFALGYMKAAARDEAHEVFLRTFIEENKVDPRVTRAFIARRSGKTPEQITRLLGSPGNCTLETLAVLFAAIGYKPTFGAEKVLERRCGNGCHPLAALNSPSSGVKEDSSLLNEKTAQTPILKPQNAAGQFARNDIDLPNIGPQIRSETVRAVHGGTKPEIRGMNPNLIDVAPPLPGHHQYERA